MLLLESGADDYVVKPFGTRELIARIRAVARRTMPEEAPERQRELGALTIDVAAHRAAMDGVELELTPKEFDLLTLLAQYPGRVLTHRQILTRLWGPAHVEDVAYLRVFIGQLRQKIEAKPSEPSIILTEPGVGYRTMDRP